MAITVLLGKPGAGKSYEAVTLLRDAVESGRPIVTNLPLKDGEDSWWGLHSDLITRIEPFREIKMGEHIVRQYAFSRVKDWHEAVCEPVDVAGVKTGPLVIVDECQWAFSGAMVKGDAERLAEVEGFLATHRHHLMDVVLCAQNHTQLPLSFKHLVEEWRELSTLKNEGIKGYSYAVYKTWTRPRQSITTGFRRYKKEVFDLYDSHALGGGAGQKGTGLASAFQRYGILKNWGWILIILALIVICYAGWQFYGMARGLFGFAGGSSVSGSKPVSEVQTFVPSVADARDSPEEAALVRLLPGEWGEPSHWDYVPPLDVPVVGLLAGGVYWSDGLYLSYTDLLRRSIVVDSSSGLCGVTLAAPEWRRSWPCYRSNNSDGLVEDGKEGS